MWRVRTRRFHLPCQWPRQTSGAVSCYTPSPRGCPTSCTWRWGQEKMLSIICVWRCRGVRASGCKVHAYDLVTYDLLIIRMCVRMQFVVHSLLTETPQVSGCLPISVGACIYINTVSCVSVCVTVTMTLRSEDRGNSVWKCPKQFPCSPPTGRNVTSHMIVMWHTPVHGLNYRGTLSVACTSNL